MKIREMENGDIALPWSMAFVIKRMDNFNIKKYTLDVRMTQIVRIKFTKLADITSLDHMQKVMDKCEKELKIRIDEEEMKLMEKEKEDNVYKTRSGNVKK